MKQPKRLTRNQREVLSANNLNWRDWALVEETEFYLKIINKSTRARKNLDKFWKGGKRK